MEEDLKKILAYHEFLKTRTNELNKASDWVKEKQAELDAQVDQLLMMSLPHPAFLKLKVDRARKEAEQSVKKVDEILTDAKKEFEQREINK